MPTPRADETRDEWMERCIPKVLEDGTAKDPKQAVAICNSMWEERSMDPEDSKLRQGTGRVEWSRPVQITEFKSKGDDWVVEGYVSIFDNIDLGNDVVRPGAFKKTLRSGPKVRFLLAHDPGQILGIPKVLKEDNKGLFGQFKISKTTLGEDVHELLNDGAIDSFSFGYETIEWKIIDEDIRELLEVRLYEASLVAIPMNPEAQVTRVKGLSMQTLAERMMYTQNMLKGIHDDTRALIDADRTLSGKKRQELKELLGMFPELDAVRTDLQSVLTAATTPRLVSPRATKHQLGELRKRLAEQNILD